MNRPWSDQTKRWVVAASAVLAVLALAAVAHVLPPFVLAAVLAYILAPVVGTLQLHLRLPRILATALVYVGLIVLIVLLPATTAPRMIQAVQSVNLDLVAFSSAVRNLAAQNPQLFVLGAQVDLTPLWDQVLRALDETTSGLPRNGDTIQGLLRSLPTFFGMTSRFASGFASGLIQLVLTLVASFYFVHDAPAIGRYLDNLVPPGYEDEITQVRREIGTIWDGFFRGQIILCVAIGVATGTALWIVGVRSAFALGVLAGILEIIPNIGPFISAVPAVILAFLQGSTHLAISNLWFGLLVMGVYVVIQQIENHLFVPRIIGGSVNLHPVVVLFGVLAGASIAGILGIFLAAPTMATVRVIGQYVYHKVLDIPVEPATGPPVRSAPPAAEIATSAASDTERPAAPESTL